VALARSLYTRQNKVIRAKLIDVVVEPGQIETIETKANQIEERLNVVNGSGSRVHTKLAH
jgi:tetrahydromethanopterin S-methyltransferase subunit G